MEPRRLTTRTLRSIWTLLSLFAGFAFVLPAQAGTNSVGARLQFPVPARDIGDGELGVGAGVTFTRMNTAYVGVGADLIHHYWPTSAGYAAAFDRYLRSTRFETLGGSRLAFTALQVTGHVKLTAPIGRRYAPWLQVGAGVYRLNRHLDEQRPVGTYAWVEGPGLDNITIEPGAYAGVGLNLHVSSAVALGMDATIHYLWSGDRSWSGENDLPNFSAFTVGTHIRFMWE